MKILKAFAKKHAALCYALVAVITACTAMSSVLLPYRALMAKNEQKNVPDPFSESYLSLVRPVGITYELEREMLAKFIFALAGNEPYVCQVSIGATVKNRSADAHFPVDISSVIFSYDPHFNSDMLSLEPSERSVNAARDALLNIDPSGGALYFFKNDDAQALAAHKNRVTASFGTYSFAK